MIPLHGQVPKGFLPLATVTLTLGCAAGFLHEMSVVDAELEGFLGRFGLVPAQVLSAIQYRPAALEGWLLPALAHPFLHGGLLHLGSNLVFLLAFGRGVEGRLGHGRLLLLFLLSALAAGGAHVAMNPTATVPMVGASGAISGIMGAYLVLYPFSRITTVIPVVVIPVFVSLPAVVFIGLWLGLQVLAVLAMEDGASDGGVAWWAHLGGFVVGPVLAALLDPGPVELD